MPSPKILCVDDEPNILRAICRVFLNEPYEVLTAESGEQGLDILQREEVALIISDQHMPGMSGVNFLERSVALAPHAVRILITGHCDDESFRKIEKEGIVSQLVLKPWCNQELRGLVSEALGR